MNLIRSSFRPVGLSVLLLGASVLSLPAQAVWTSGHGDIGVGYEGGELHGHWHIEGGVVDGTPRPDEEFEPDALWLVVPDVPQTQAIRNANSAWDPIGVGAGQPFWRLSSSSQSGVPYMGWATEELEVSEWTGDISFTLTGLVGPGDISVYYFPDGDLTFLWASSDGLGDSFGIEPGFHEHFNVAFTAPGIYEVEITFSGTHVTDGVVSSTETFTFQVVPEPTSALLVAAGAAGLAVLRRRRK